MAEKQSEYAFPHTKKTGALRNEAPRFLSFTHYEAASASTSLPLSHAARIFSINCLATSADEPVMN